MKRKFPFFVTLSIAAFLGLSFFSPKQEVISQEQPSYLWQVRSVDTMKTSRDKARVRLHDFKFDTEIEKELLAVKNLGANYVAIDTPYDEEFLPYLTRWVQLARKMGLRVWFRGNWSNWEGWFDYPKNLTPERHHAKTAEFIETHPDLFEDQDIFDPCPECENAGFWKQPDDNAKYNEFLRNQMVILKNSFSKINKKVYTNVFSIIGGRAKEVVDKQTLDALDNLVTIDHYVRNPQSMAEYLDYFPKNLGAKIILGEFGAPIPGINGAMTEEEQADFIDAILGEVYKSRKYVIGVNYWTLLGGSTALLSSDFEPRKVTDVIKKYFMPGIIKGNVKNTLSENIKGLRIEINDGLDNVLTDKNGNFIITVPAGRVKMTFDKSGFIPYTKDLLIGNGEKVIENVIVEPRNVNVLYRIKLYLKQLLNKLPARKRIS